ncbi:MAG: methyl-accepting chemotaxis protein [Campylobacterota bacterium]|nr:methyl-accepting chemotaxis protein [Campylobacterota bacterium]
MFQNMTIKSKIVSITMLGLVLLAVILSTISVSTAKDALMKKSYDGLTSARDSKAEQISNFFAERIGDIKVLARSSNIVDLIDDLNGLDAKLSIDPKASFPVSNPIVKKITAPHEPFFQAYAKDYGYYDIFLIDPADGHVIYTQAKESDYGANLVTGDLKNSGLGEAFVKANQNNRPTFIDMKPYAPSAGAPAMFLGMPVYVNDKKIAILVFQISDASINKIMQFREGYGDSQEDYLVGQDKLMRSDSYLDPKGHSLKASFANNAMADTEASRAALAGQKDTKIVIDYNGNPVLSSYAPVKIGQDLNWAILSEIDEAEVLITPNYIRNSMIIISLVLLTVIAFIVYMVIIKGVINPLNNFQDGLLNFFKYLNRENGDVTLLDDNSNDEIGTMAKVVNQNITKTKDGIEAERKLIDEGITVMSEFESGDMCQRISGNSNNPALNELKDVINKMGNTMELNIDGVLDILEQYSNSNYINKVKNNGIKEHLLKLANGVNELGGAITVMLVDNKQNGLTLDNSSDVLLKNVDLLNNNSNEAAAALEETAAAVEEVTSNISSTTQNVIAMASHGNEVKVSVAKGQNLANKTTTAMDEINTEVTSISEAITVIDQIAFQTNILSLNAAVEAATAGEAGKGFAVVAQEVRNLASRSAEAAGEIKALVANARDKANDGKKIADDMIDGYTHLNESISKTLELISDVESASKEQQTGIVQINDAINSLDKQTQENAAIASQTHDVAITTDKIAKLVVSSADEKEFIGKSAVKAHDTGTQASSSVEPKQNISKSNKQQDTTRKVLNKPNGKIKPVVSNSSDDEWASF